MTHLQSTRRCRTCQLDKPRDEFGYTLRANGRCHPTRLECQSCVDNDTRFWSRVEKSEGCWLWQGMTDSAGYGYLERGGVNWAAHRYSFVINCGPIIEGFDVCHTCDTPGCVRPDHLWQGTHVDNMADKVAKGRQSSLRGSRNRSAKLDEELVGAIRAKYQRGAYGYGRLAAEYGVSPRAIEMIIARATWKHVE